MSLVRSVEDRRLVFADALRGLAAAAVVLHHLLYNTVMGEPLRTVLPGAIEQVMTFGKYGVQVFFVLSGFVITWSLRRTILDAKGEGRFALRRQVRLDPTYWAVIVATLVLAALESGLGFREAESFTPGAVLLNALYLQNITGSAEVVGVAWTLCLEIQFYVLLLVLLRVMRTFRLPAGPDAARPGLVPVLWVTGLTSLVIALATDAPQWATEFWFYFAIGALVAITTREPGRAVLWPVSLTVIMLAASAAAPGDGHLRYALAGPVAATFAVAVLVVGHRGSERLNRVSAAAVLQYLGQRSYSLYLVHLLALSAALRAGYKVTGDNGWAALGWLVVAVGVVLLATEALYRGVERPSLRVAGHLRTHGAQATAAAVRRRVRV